MLSDRVQRIGFSSTLRIAAKAAQMKQDGIDLIDFSIGEPDFPTPTNIKDAAKRALDANLTRYPPNEGVLELRQAICGKFKDEFGAIYTPDQVLVSTGAKQSLYNAGLALINKGEEVLIPAPYWVSYPQMVNLAYGNPVFIPTREENGFRITTEDLTRHLSSRTKAIILSNPSNPTGSAYPASELQKIVDVCLAEGIFIISDEIYEKLIYDGFRYVSVAALGDQVRENSVVINGFSKAYSMTGWRLGYAVGPREVIEGMSKIQSHSTSGANSIAQWAGVEALNGSQHEIIRMRGEFERRRNTVLYKLAQIPHCSCYKPEGAFYVYPNLSWYYDKAYDGVEIRNSAGLAYYLLKQAQLALVPGESFGTDDFIRISYATSMKNIETGMERLTNALARLTPSFKVRAASLNNTPTKQKDYVALQVVADGRVKDGLAAEADAAISYDSYSEWNVNIGGVVLKLITNSPHLADFWQENWYPAALESDLEPHGVIYGVKDAPGREASAYYHPSSRSGFVVNTAFYPQVRRMALGMVEEIGGAMFDLQLVGGSCIEVNGKGVALIAPPGSGGGTHFAALLRRPDAKLHSYDAFFVRWSGSKPIADAVERKLLMKTELTDKLPELTRLFDRSKTENVVTRRDECETAACSHSDLCPIDRGEARCYYASERSRGLIDPYWIGQDKHVKRTPLARIILLKRESLGAKVTKPSTEAALKILEEGAIVSARGGYRSQPFFNPYLLDVTSERLERLRRQWRRLLDAAPLVVINTEVMRKEEAVEAVGREL